MPDLQKEMTELGKNLLKSGSELAAVVGREAGKSASLLVDKIGTEIEKSKSITNSKEYKALQTDKQRLEGERYLFLWIAALCFLFGLGSLMARLWPAAALCILAGICLFFFNQKHQAKVEAELAAVQKKINRYDDLEFARKAKNIQPNQKQSSEQTMVHSYSTRTKLEISMREKNLKARKDNLDSVLEVVFAGSQITKNRYKAGFEKAQAAAMDNLAKAKLALSDGQEPSPQRKQIIQTYLSRADATIDKMDAVVNELLVLDQCQNADHIVDDALSELQETTKYYA